MTTRCVRRGAASVQTLPSNPRRPARHVEPAWGTAGGRRHRISRCRRAAVENPGADVIVPLPRDEARDRESTRPSCRARPSATRRQARSRANTRGPSALGVNASVMMRPAGGKGAAHVDDTIAYFRAVSDHRADWGRRAAGVANAHARRAGRTELDQLRTVASSIGTRSARTRARKVETSMMQYRRCTCLRPVAISAPSAGSATSVTV